MKRLLLAAFLLWTPLAPLAFLAAPQAIAATIDSRGFAQAPGTTTSGIQEAINALPIQGGDVELPSGSFPITTTILFPNDRPCRLLGAGIGATTLSMAAAYKDINMIEVRGDYQGVEGMTLSGQAVSGKGRGIQIGRIAADATGDVLKRAQIQNVRIRNTASWGIAFYGGLSGGAAETEDGPKTAVDANSLSIESLIRDCEISGFYSGGGIKVGYHCTTIYVEDSTVHDWVAGDGIHADNVEELHVSNTTIEPGLDANYIRLNGGHNNSFRNVWLEENPGNPGTPTKYMIEVDKTQNCVWENIRFVRNNPGTGAQKFAHFGGASIGNFIINWMGSATGTDGGTDHVLIDAPSTNNNVGACILGDHFVGTPTAFVPMIFTINGSLPYSSLLGNKRLRLPWLNSSNRDDASVFVNKTQGDIIYNAGSGKNVLQLYNGASWRSFPHPILTTAQRDAETTALGLQDGDICYVTDAPAGQELQIRVGGAWKYLTHN